MTLRDFNVANENIDRTIEVVEDILLQFDIARRVTCSFPFCCYKFELEFCSNPSLFDC
jgi:hypothetical protein